jgi:hypothetical protein
MHGAYNVKMPFQDIWITSKW